MRWDDLTGEEVFEGIFRQSLAGEQSTVTRYTYAPGSIYPLHQHPEEQITVVHSGQIAFDIAGKRTILTAGSVAIIPGNTPHGAQVIGPETVVTDNYIPAGQRTAPDYR